MARDIKALLGKKGWTGKEVGQALIASLVHDAKNKGGNKKPLFSQANLERMESNLKSKNDLIAYRVYQSLYYAFVDGFNKAQALYQQFYNGFYRYYGYIQQANNGEKDLKEKEHTPLIMTQQQYNRITAQLLEGKRSIAVSFRVILFDLLEVYLDDIENAPEAIKTAIEATKNEPVTNKRILENYNTDIDYGYYTLPDGRRSDQMKQEEWERALLEEETKDQKLIINGKPASMEAVATLNRHERYLKGLKIMYEGAEGIERLLETHGLTTPDVHPLNVLEELEELIYKIGNSEAGIPAEYTDIYEAILKESALTKWHYYPDPPADLNKFDVLEWRETLGRYSVAYQDRLYNGEYIKEVSETAAFTEFRKDYPALFIALKEEIERLVPQAKGLKESQYNKNIATYGDLADLGISFYKGLLKIRDQDIADYYTGKGAYTESERALYRGVAIIQNPSARFVGENGDYEELRSAYSYSNFLALDNITESEEFNVRTPREELIKPALSYLYAYNALVDILCEAYEIDGAEHLKIKLTTFESQIEGLNGSIYMLYNNVYGGKEEKARKRKLVKETFKTIDYEKLKPAPEAITNTQKEIGSLGLSMDAGTKLRRLDTYIDYLMAEGMKDE